MKLAKYTVEIECPEAWADGQGKRIDDACDALLDLDIEDLIKTTVKTATESRTMLEGVTVKVVPA